MIQYNNDNDTIPLSPAPVYNRLATLLLDTDTLPFILQRQTIFTAWDVRVRVLVHPSPRLPPFLIVILNCMI